MRVCLDMRASIGGLARYAAVLHQGLNARADIEAVGFGEGSASWGGPPRTAPAAGPAAGRLLRGWTRLPRRLFEDTLRFAPAARHADVVHATGGCAPLTGAGPLVVTCHDFWAVDRPDTRPDRLLALYERRRFLAGLRTAHRVITDTQFGAAELQRRFGIGGERVVHLPPPLPPPATPDAAGVADLDLPPRFFLGVGTLEPRKNYRRLLSAQRAAYPVTGVPLLIAGRYGWRDPALPAEMDRAAPAVRRLGYVTDGVLAGLYARTLALVSFSHDEGFNYPVLEAMRAGRPVIVSDIPVHREVAGDAAVRVPPDDGHALAAALVTTAQRPAGSLAGRAAAALRRARRLGARGDIARYVAVYEAAMRASTPPERNAP